MALVKLLDDPTHMIWRESDANVLNGGESVRILTPFPQTMTVDHQQVVGKVTLFSVTGTPNVDTTFRWSGGQFEITLHNRAASGNKAAFTLDLWVADEVGGDFSPSISVVTATSEVPETTVLRLYVDGTNGNDGASGQGGWANAWKTWNGKVIDALAALLVTEPSNLVTTLNVRGSFSEDVRLRLHLMGRSQVHIVHAIDDFTTVRTGTVSAVGGSTYDCGLERLTLLGAALDGTEIGMTLCLDDPIAGSRATCTILRVDVGNQYVWVNQMAGEFPAWVAASPARAKVIVPSCYIDGTFCLHMERGTGLTNSAVPANLEPLSYVVGLRTANRIVLRGSGIAHAGCYARTTGGTWKDYVVRADNIILSTYQRTPTDYNLTDALAEEFGLIHGPTPTTYNTLGNAGNQGDIGGRGTYFSGYLADRAGVYGEAGIYDRFSAGYWYLLGSYGQFSAGISRATSSSYGAVHCHHGSMRVNKISFLDLPAAGAVYGLFRTERQGASIDVTDANVDGNNTGSGTDLRVVWARGGGVIFRSTVDANLKSKHRQFVAEEGGSVVCRGAVTFGANEGGGPDAYAGSAGSIIEFQDNVTKSATNPSGGGTAQPVLKWERGGRIAQTSGKSFTLPAGSGNHTTDYGATGAMDGDFSEACLGTLTGGGGGSTGVACTLRYGARLRHGGAGISGTSPLKLGAAAAQAWPANPKSDHGEANYEDCWIYPNVA